MDRDCSVSFVLPMFNEEENVENTIKKLITVLNDLSNDYEVIIVDDASTDGSVKVAENIAAQNKKIKVFKLAKNTKFGGAFARCFKEATKDIIMYMDSDMPVSIDDIKKSFPLIRDADIVTGYSTIKKGDTLKRKLISGTYNFIVQTLFKLNVKDINSGYKIVRRSFAKDIEFISKSPFIDVELFLHARKKKAKITQYPLVFHPREGGKSYIARIPVIFATFRDMLKVRIIKWIKN